MLLRCSIGSYFYRCVHAVFKLILTFWDLLWLNLLIFSMCWLSVQGLEIAKPLLSPEDVRSYSSRILKYHFVFVYLRCPRCCVVTIFSSENLKVGSRNGLKRWEIFDLLMVYFLFFAENILPTQHLGHLYLQIQNNSSRLYSTNCTYSTYIEYTYIQVKLCQEGNIAL